ncbi:MAG: DNA alkylation repair protein [Deltaproteobacteria bacterium]|nr:DNA alkylation repair protein [Deltaproteobacteria bacterium]
MPANLKDILNETAIRAMGRALRGVDASFDADAFARDAISGLADRELLQRAAWIADAMHRRLPKEYATAIDIVVRSLPPPLTRTDDFGYEILCMLPHVMFVERHGLDHFESSIAAQYELTKRFSAERSIRAFLVRYPAETLSVLKTWATDADPHVRRLVSEGIRPRLPWAPRLRDFQVDPSPVIELLELLRDDDERYVHRSVANCMNDIGKDHPDRLVDLCRKWMDGAPSGRKWIVGHALRSLVKAGHPGALEILGAGAKPRVSVASVRFDPPRVKIGGRVEAWIELRSESRVAQDLLIDFAVHFVKSNGTRRPKVFKLRRLELDAGVTITLRANVSFEPMTTRRSYPGRHAMDLRINGVVFPVGEFDVK